MHNRFDGYGYPRRRNIMSTLHELKEVGLDSTLLTIILPTYETFASRTVTVTDEKTAGKSKTSLEFKTETAYRHCNIG